MCVGVLQNNTSWVLYNMAAFYWRIKGSPYHVVECVRRALHFSPWYVVIVVECVRRTLVHDLQNGHVKVHMFCTSV